jgi:large subunit ribosomal protein LX
MKAFRVKGLFKMGNRMQPFEKELVAETKNAAEEKILSTLGSRHRVKRKEIKIENIQEIKEEEITDPVVKYILKKNLSGGKLNE